MARAGVDAEEEVTAGLRSEGIMRRMIVMLTTVVLLISASLAPALAWIILALAAGGLVAGASVIFIVRRTRRVRRPTR